MRTVTQDNELGNQDPGLPPGASEWNIGDAADYRATSLPADEADARQLDAAVQCFADRELGDVIASLDDHCDAAIGAMVRRAWNRIVNAADVP
jgi:hypothetical protein